MNTTFKTVVIGEGNHASFVIPAENLMEIGGNRRAPLKITINGHTYQSTATGVDGECRVVFPMRDRKASGTKAGDEITVNLELDDGYRMVEIPSALDKTLKAEGLERVFHGSIYSKRKEFARLVDEAKSDETRNRRIKKIIDALRPHS